MAKNSETKNVETKAPETKIAVTPVAERDPFVVVEGTDGDLSVIAWGRLTEKVEDGSVARSRGNVFRLGRLLESLDRVTVCDGQPEIDFECNTVLVGELGPNEWHARYEYEVGEKAPRTVERSNTKKGALPKDWKEGDADTRGIDGGPDLLKFLTATGAAVYPDLIKERAEASATKAKLTAAVAEKDQVINQLQAQLAAMVAFMQSQGMAVPEAAPAPAPAPEAK